MGYDEEDELMMRRCWWSLKWGMVLFLATFFVLLFAACISPRGIQLGSTDKSAVESKASIKTSLGSKDVQIRNEGSGTVRVSNNDWKGMIAAFGGGMVIPSPLHVWWQRRKAKRGQKC